MKIFNPLQLTQPYFRVAVFLALFLLPATLIRIALYTIYHEDFNSLTAFQVVTAFVVGLRFDLSLAAMVIGLPLLLMLLPLQWSHHRYWQRCWGWFIYVAVLIFILMMIIDSVYFGYVHRHVGAEINALSADMDSMVSIALNQFRDALLAFVVGALLLAWFWRGLLAGIPAVPAKKVLRWSMLGVVFFLILLAGRGGVSGKPISVGEAFFSDSLPQGYLTLNGAFAMSRALIEETPPLKQFMPQDQAVTIVQQVLASQHSTFQNKDFPLFRPAGNATQAKPNVVVLMLESWGASHIDAIRKTQGLPPLGVTQNFDALAKQGRLYTRFYANGQRSIQGAEAILASLPTFPFMPFLGEGIEQNRQSFLGELALNSGYETFFLQSSGRHSFRFEAIAARAGFVQYRGAEDMPNLHKIPKPGGAWGTWDHNTFQEAHRLFAASRKPFLGFIFTSTTHIPWSIPEQRWHKYTGSANRDNYLNSLLYADWALGEFIAAAKQAGYFENTIFVLTADHADEFIEHADQVPNLFHIPLLILGPGVTHGIDTRIASQFDIVPTLNELAGWNSAYAGLGRSLLDNSYPEARAVLAVRGNALDWITARGWVSHDLNRRMGDSGNLTPLEADIMEQNLLATYQVTSQLLVKNQILPPK